jgi:hypothetical protein
MNYIQLQQAILDDTHKSQYVGAAVQRFIAQGESLIATILESYNLQGQLLDANRVSANSANYVLPAGLVNLRYAKINGLPLGRVDETRVSLYLSANSSTMYAQRAKQIIVAGTPGTGVVIDIDYMGMPDALATTATNTLLDEVPQLYIDAASVYVFRRAQDYEGAGISMDSVKTMCADLNRKSKKLLGGAQATPIYNTDFRSAY